LLLGKLGWRAEELIEKERLAYLVRLQVRLRLAKKRGWVITEVSPPIQPEDNERLVELVRFQNRARQRAWQARQVVG
jgi:hypothetical protein